MRLSVKILLYGFFIVLILTAVYGFYHSLQKPFTLDEIIMVKTSSKLTTMGPNAYLPPSEGGGGELFPHPPLYDYLNAFIIKLFGAKEFVLRSNGLFFYLATLIMLVMLVSRQFSDNVDKVKKGILIAVSIYIINPLIIQYSILIDGDSAVTAFLITLFMYLFIKYDDLSGKKFMLSRCLLAVVLCVCFMIKELTPILLAVSILLFRAIEGKPKKLFADLAITVTGGVLLFWSVWSLYCYFTGTGLFVFLEHTLFTKSVKITPWFILKQLNPKLVLLKLKWLFYWATAPFSLLVLSSFLMFAIDLLRTKRIKAEGVIFITSFVVFVTYQFTKPSVEMVKYQYPIYPLFVFAIVWFFLKFIFTGESDRGFDGKDDIRILASLSAITLLGFVYYHNLGDYLLILWRIFSWKFYLRYYFPIFAMIFFCVLLFRKKHKYRNICMALLFSVYPISLGLDVNQAEPYTTSSPWMNYGEEGFAQTVSYLAEHIDESKVLIARGDIVYYLQFQYHKDVQAKAPRDIYIEKDDNKLVKQFTEGNIEYFVFDSIWRTRRVRQNVLNVIERYFIVEKQFGDFYVLKNKKSFWRK